MPMCDQKNPGRITLWRCNQGSGGRGHEGDPQAINARLRIGEIRAMCHGWACLVFVLICFDWFVALTEVCYFAV